ncbi:retrovirus-related pol polyprotein from transposon TNT 1-94 [Tanacetum coccineum]
MDMSKETCFACGKLGHFQKDYPSNKTFTPPYPSANKSYNKPKFYTNPTPQNNPNVNKNQKDYKVKYKGLKAEIVVLTQRIDAMSNGNSEKGLVAKSYDWDDESVSSDEEGVITVKAFMAIADEELPVGRTDARSGQWVDITMKKDKIFDLKKVIEKWASSKVTLDQLLSEQSDESSSKTRPEIPSDFKSKGNTQAPLSSLPKLVGAEPSGIKKCLTFPVTKQTIDKMTPIIVTQKTETKTSLDSPTEKLLLTLMQEVKGLKEQIKNHSETSPPTSYSGSSRSAKGKNSGCSRHMTGVKQYLHRYSKESGPKVVFRDKSLGDIEGYGSVIYNGIIFTRVAYVNGLKHNLISISQLCDANFKILFTKTQGTIFNQNNKVVLIALRRRDVYVIDMSSYNEESNACFFAKASPSVNWLWHKRLSHLNFKNINKLAKQNLVAGLSSLTFSKDKTCLAYEKGKHHRASFKTKRSFSINKSLHLLHMDLFGPVKPQSISHNKYTLVIVDEYSRYTWVFCLKKKSDTAECIISFIRIENINEVKVKELRNDNGTEFKNHQLEEFCDEKGIS